MARTLIRHPKKASLRAIVTSRYHDGRMKHDSLRPRQPHESSYKNSRETTINKTKPMDESAIRVLLDTTFAPWIRDLGLTPASSTDTSVTLRLPHADKLRHAGAVICGQVFMAAADTAMIVAIAHALGGFQPMTTVSLTTSFLRPVKTGDVLVTASILRRGRNLIFGEIELRNETGALAAHATTTVMLLT
jgi:uncharacterized protein (TIGR00369 family)